MAWTANFTQDTEINGVGTASAFYAKATTDPVIVSHSRRIDTNITADIVAFSAECQALLDAHLAKKTGAEIFAAKIAAGLNK